PAGPGDDRTRRSRGMRMKFWTLFAGALGLGAALACGVNAQRGNPPPVPAEETQGLPQGSEVLARGPVHEAYAEPTDPRPPASPLVTRQAPEAIERVAPGERPEGDNVVWIPGYWSYEEDQENFVWVSGFWRDAPPGRTWVPGAWQPVEGGSHWVAGFWTSD